MKRAVQNGSEALVLPFGQRLREVRRVKLMVSNGTEGYADRTAQPLPREEARV